MATLRMPISVHARNTRMAISPLTIIEIFMIINAIIKIINEIIKLIRVIIIFMIWSRYDGKCLCWQDCWWESHLLATRLWSLSLWFEHFKKHPGVGGKSLTCWQRGLSWSAEPAKIKIMIICNLVILNIWIWSYCRLWLSRINHDIEFDPDLKVLYW